MKKQWIRMNKIPEGHYAFEKNNCKDFENNTDIILAVQWVSM